MFKAIRQGAARALGALARVFRANRTEVPPEAVAAHGEAPRRRGEAVVIEAGPGRGGRVFIAGCDASRFIRSVSIDLAGDHPPAVSLEIPASVVRLSAENFRCDLSQMPRGLARQLLVQLREAFPDA